MATKGKKYVDSAKLIDRAVQYEVTEAMELVMSRLKKVKSNIEFLLTLQPGQ